MAEGDPIASMSLRELSLELRRRGIPTRGYVERAEIEERLRRVMEEEERVRTQARGSGSATHSGQGSGGQREGQRAQPQPAARPSSAAAPSPGEGQNRGDGNSLRGVPEWMNRFLPGQVKGVLQNVPENSRMLVIVMAALIFLAAIVRLCFGPVLRTYLEEQGYFDLPSSSSAYPPSPSPSPSFSSRRGYGAKKQGNPSSSPPPPSSSYSGFHISPLLDISYQSGNTSFYFPVGSMLLLSLLLNGGQVIGMVRNMFRPPPQPDHTFQHAQQGVSGGGGGGGGR